MPALAAEEQANLENRRSRFDQFLAERMPVLADFADALELKNPSLIVASPEEYLPAIDMFLSEQTIEPDDWNWILTRLGYFVGELLVQRLGGCWLLNETPESRHFLRYVVGAFQSVPDADATVDPFYVAESFLRQPPKRYLTATVATVEAELRSA